MRSRNRFSILTALGSLMLLTGCGGFGKVNQGRVIHYDAAKGLVTLIGDSNYTQAGNPRYDVLPPVTVAIPEDPKQMGPAPAAGKLVRLDTGQKEAVIFDDASRQLKTISYTLVEQDDSVFSDDPRVVGESFPAVDRAKKTITVYSPKRKQLVTFSVPDEYFSLPEDTWEAGDEVRYYYKDPGRALRLMNVTRAQLN